MVKSGVRHDYDLRSNLCTDDEAMCVVCDEKLKGNTRWTDSFGEAVCITCEIPYQLLRPSGMAEDVELPKCNIKPEWLPRLKEYWEEKSQPMGLGTYLITRDYEEDLEHRRTFGRWCEERGYG